MVTIRIGGAAESASSCLAASDTYGHASRATFLAATCMANAMHVGNLHSPQLVLGNSL